jgi:hypothetical protein
METRPDFDHAHRKPSVKLEELQTDGLNGAEVKQIHDWFTDVDSRHGISYHEEIREISVRLRGLLPQPSFQRIGSIFQLARGTIHKYVVELRWLSRLEGRPHLLTEEHIASISGFVTERFESRRPVSFADIANHLSEEFGIQMRIPLVRHQIVKLPGFRAVKGLPMDARRLECDPAQIAHYYAALDAMPQDFPAALVVNIDETAHQEWVETHAEKVAVPEFYEEATI